MKADRVEKPPQKPVIVKSANVVLCSLLQGDTTNHPANIPIRKQAMEFTTNVPKPCSGPVVRVANNIR